MIHNHKFKVWQVYPSKVPPLTEEVLATTEYENKEIQEICNSIDVIKNISVQLMSMVNIGQDRKVI